MPSCGEVSARPIAIVTCPLTRTLVPDLETRTGTWTRRTSSASSRARHWFLSSCRKLVHEIPPLSLVRTLAHGGTMHTCARSDPSPPIKVSNKLIKTLGKLLREAPNTASRGLAPRACDLTPCLTARQMSPTTRPNL
jgi:hypothetical protein